MSQSTRLTDGRTDRILIARSRLHSMQRGKNVVDVGHFGNGCVIAHSFSAGVSLNQALRTTAIGPQFSGDLVLVVTHPIKNNECFSRHCPRNSYVWAIYVELSSLTLPLCQCIRPFTIMQHKTLSGPPLHRDRALLPPCPRSGGSAQWRH